MSEVQDTRELSRRAQTAISRVNELSSDVDQLKAQGAKVLAASAKIDQDMVVVRCVMQQANELRQLIETARSVVDDSVAARVGAVEEELGNLSKKFLELQGSVQQIVELAEVPDEACQAEVQVQRHEKMLQALNSRINELETKQVIVETILNHSSEYPVLTRYREASIRIRKVGIAEMNEYELRQEVCKVLEGVLENFEGNDSELIDFGENRVKDLLSEIRTRYTPSSESDQWYANEIRRQKGNAPA